MKKDRHGPKWIQLITKGWWTVQMIILLGLWFLTVADGGDCPVKCKCINLTGNTIKVDCSLRNLENIPSFPEETEELYLQENLLTTVPIGAFDNLVKLKKLNLSSNPLHCDAKIWYLMMWISDGDMDVASGIKCSSPSSLYGKPVSQLSGREIASCSRPSKHCSDFLFNDAFLYALLFLLFFLMILCMNTFKMMKFEISKRK
ncbi:platelet glycoprotein IX-like [Mixophyes fleayi]|uniref:platelet glycoprotein IX-like n=1 Tax=Mixophyes fleayi TaxID=3061075 RepID=UPI003F4E34BE